jgi:transcriptional regulator with XRE-family HTH domain
MISNLTEAGKNLTKNTARLQGAVALTTIELANFTGVSERTLRRIETARKARRTYHPAFSTVARLANFAGVTVDDYVKLHLQFS